MKETTFGPNESRIIAELLVDRYKTFEKERLGFLNDGLVDLADARFMHLAQLGDMIVRTGYWTEHDYQVHYDVHSVTR
jgi:hypothetical protein